MAYTLDDPSIRNLTFCLSFCNTADWHASAHPVEGLTTLADLIDWEERRGVLSPGQAGRLRAFATADPTAAETLRLEAIALREALYRVFVARIGQEDIPVGDLVHINAILQEGTARASLQEEEDGFHWSWREDEADGRLLLWPAAHSAARLLTDGKLTGRVRQCASEQGCGVLFLDRTRNGSRRWCSMRSCGNRAKARRHYRRVKQAE